MEVVFTTDDLRLVFLNALYLVSPFTGQLQCRFIPFSAGIHRKNPLVAEIFRDKLLINAEHIIIKGP